uniref:Uncharacterized protein n=1 Tax=viral metagenome TaxID=1070528 RepID=A0A6M3IX52_9ZZZZ
MATIYDKGDNWHLVIAPNAKAVKKIDEPLKGYSATLGEDETGKHVVMDVHYNKDTYTLDNVQKFVKRSRDCPQCAALDKERMNLDSIELRDEQPDNFLSADKTLTKTDDERFSPAFSQKAEQVQAQATKQPLSPLKDIFANVFFDAYLTTPGKYFLGMMLNDDRILESAMPKDQAGIPNFMEEMVDFLAGKIDFVRSPDEVKDYLSILKKDDEDTSTQLSRTNNRRKKKGSGQAVLIY